MLLRFPVIPQAAIWSTFRLPVHADDGRIVLVHPCVQMVLWMFPWFTFGFVAPGVQVASGRTLVLRPTIRQPVGTER